MTSRVPSTEARRVASYHSRHAPMASTEAPTAMSSSFVGPDGEPWTPPTTEEMLSRGTAPVKREYLRPLKPIIPSVPVVPSAAEAPQDASAPAGNGTTPGEAVDGSRPRRERRRSVAPPPLPPRRRPSDGGSPHRGSRRSLCRCEHFFLQKSVFFFLDAFLTSTKVRRIARREMRVDTRVQTRAQTSESPDARGARRREGPCDAGVRGAEHGVDKNRTGKSRRQQAREKQEARKQGAELCTAFVKGICSYANCRYSHDVDLYVSAKPFDLPGVCPFIAGGKVHCPHGVMCRYFASHPRESSAEAGALNVSDEAVAALAAKNEAADTSGIMALPTPAGEIQEELNAFAGDLKVRLRKGIVRFDKADALLAQLGVKTSWRYSSEAKKASKGNKGVDGKKSDAAWGEDSVEVGGSKGDAVRDEGEGDRKRRRAEDGSAVAATEDAENKAEGVDVKLRLEEKKLVDFRGKLYLAPLTTTGNLPFRRICKGFGVDITCGEMAMCTNLLQGNPAEWALLRRHPCEDIFGIQVCGGYSDSVSRCAQLLEDEVVSKGGIDFVDINMGCPIDLVCNKGAGSKLLEKPARMEQIVRASAPLLSCPLTLKTRMGYYDNKRVVHELIPKMQDWGLAGMTLHGRSRQQRYSRLADWAYIKECADLSPLPLIGNGDVYSYHDYRENVENSGVATCMVARGALIKPWVFTEIKERRDWDISASERLDMLKEFCAFGLEHWGSDARGVESTRRFLLEWLSFLCRYVPIGLLDRLPVGIHQRPPSYVGRSDLETLLSSNQAEDWVKISTMLLGPPPENFSFKPKHKSNAYSKESEGGMAQQDFGEANG